MKKTLTMDGTTARKIYPTASAEVRILLEESFGAEYFSRDITERIKTIDDAYEAIGEVRPSDDDFKERGLTPDEIHRRHLKVIAKALNEGWEADMYNTEQNKYYPWFEVGSSSFAFGGTYYSYSRAYAGHASRLCFKSAELARYAGQQFTALFEKSIVE